MRHSIWLRFLVIGILVSIGLALSSFFFLRELNESSTADVRRNMTLFMAQAVESGPNYPEALQALRAKSGRRFSGTRLWVFSEEGKLLASTTESEPPVSFESLKKPAGPHDFVFHYRFLRLIPDLSVVKLESKPDAYLLIEFRHPSTARGGISVQIAFVLFMVGASILIAVGLMYAYLRKKSLEARGVLARLEKGDLKARFEIKRVDEIGSLMVDFNRMASEIERLVHRIQDTENARKNLLEELSHDLRTPLTSLKTSAETLHDHWNEMPKETQWEFVTVIQSELGYFLHLIEELFFIASIGEPRYKKTTAPISVEELIAHELKAHERSHPKLKWKREGTESAQAGSVILGDPILVQRLLRNALDNAAKHAESTVVARIKADSRAVIVEIEDDGVGISDEAISRFAQRQKNRYLVSGSLEGSSLGLGSVIMRTILELHGGSFSIRRMEKGTQLSLLLPKEGVS